MKKTLVTGAIAATLTLVTSCQSLSKPKPSDATPQLSSGIELQYIDKSVRPQDDFYLYVNGGWLKTHEIPADKTAIGSFYSLRDKADEDVKAIIEELAARSDLKAGSDEQKIADMYRAFMNVDQLNELGLKPLAKEFGEIDKLSSYSDFEQYLAVLRTRGVSNPLLFYVSVDAKNAKQYAAHIWQGGLGLPDRDYYLSDKPRYQKLRKAYLAHLTAMFKLAGFSSPEKTAKDVFDFEKKLAELHWTRVESRDSEKRYNKFSREALKKFAPEFDWDGYFAALGVPDLDQVIINQPSFVRGFAELTIKTPLPVLKNYLRWLVLNDAASYLSQDFDKQNFEFYGKVLSGQQQQKPRWKRGVSLVNGTLGELVGKRYVARHFKPEAKARMTQLVENLRKAYAESIDQLDWMSEATKKQAKAKLAAFRPKIGYPDRWHDYSELQIRADDLIGNLRRVALDAHKKSIDKLDEPVRDWEWGMTPQTVNAYYSPTRNEIVFPAAILQPPFFNMEADDAVNYGGIGAVIGHEMGHGFDDQGSRYDGEGNLRNWWTKRDLEEFKKRTQQLVEQYNQYKPFPDVHVNGQLTLGENIGDLAGVTIAYKAYKMSLNGKPAPVIDGLTGDQRFFMGFAQIWRIKMREKALRNRIATDPHSPAHYRTIGPLSNVPEFYEAFDVKPGDKMYLPPEKRVKIW
ncbi:MAG: M13 family peptidase [Gammaproteobacteria bacterium]|nr:MAG: M13 family peptidase [Gammaproteobacteria bacterium]